MSGFRYDATLTAAVGQPPGLRKSPKLFKLTGPTRALDRLCRWTASTGLLNFNRKRATAEMSRSPNSAFQFNNADKCRN